MVETERVSRDFVGRQRRRREDAATKLAFSSLQGEHDGFVADTTAPACESRVRKAHQSAAGAIALPVSILNETDSLVDDLAGGVTCAHVADAEKLGSKDALEELAAGVVDAECLARPVGLVAAREGGIVEWAEPAIGYCDSISIAVSACQACLSHPCIRTACVEYEREDAAAEGDSGHVDSATESHERLLDVRNIVSGGLAFGFADSIPA